MPSTNGFKVELIDRQEALGEVIDPWRRLAVERGNAFVTPEWYLAASKTLHEGSMPAVAVVREGDGAIRGLLPFLDIRSGRSPRLASFPGTRYGDLYHPVAAEDDDELIATAVAPALARHLGSRCQLDLGRVDAGARWWRQLAGAWPAGMATVPRPEQTLPYIDLDGSNWEDYLAGRSRQFRSQLGRKMRRLRRDHQVRIRQSAAAAEVPGDIDTLFVLHDARWQGKGEASALADPEARRLLVEFAVEAHQRGWLRLYLLEVDGAAVAGWLGWRLGERLSYYQAGFDPAWASHSVGFLLFAETVREAIAEGAAEYDLLLGDEPFKARFATGKRLGRSVLLAPRMSGARLTATARAWIAGARG